MGSHSEYTEDDALRIWREAGDSIPSQINAMGQIFGLTALEDDEDEGDAMLNAAFASIFAAAAGEYSKLPDNFDRATILPGHLWKVSPTAKAVSEAVKKMGAYMEAEDAKVQAEILAREQAKAAE